MCVNKCVNGVGMRSSLRCSKCLSVVATRMNGLRLAPNITIEHRNSLINWSSWMLYHKIRCSSQILFVNLYLKDYVLNIISNN